MRKIQGIFAIGFLFCATIYVLADSWSPGGKIAQNTVLAGSDGAGNAAPAPRQIVNGDITNATIDVTTKVTGILPSANGGTANGFFAISGPATSTKTWTIPNQSMTWTGPTATRTYTLPDADSTIVSTTATQTISGAKTFANGNVYILDSGSDHTIQFLTNNESNNRTLTIPLLGANDTFATLGVANTFTAIPQFSANRKRRATTQTVTDSTALVADNTLSVTVITGRKYNFRLVYYFTTVNTSGVQVTLDGGSCTFTSYQADAALYSLSASTFLSIVERTSAATASGLTATGTSCKVIIEGGFVCNAGGTFIPRFAQTTETGAAESVVAKVDSFLWVEDMP
jgi:hypothetical protein